MRRGPREMLTVRARPGTRVRSWRSVQRLRARRRLRDLRLRYRAHARDRHRRRPDGPGDRVPAGPRRPRRDPARGARHRPRPGLVARADADHPAHLPVGGLHRARARRPTGCGRSSPTTSASSCSCPRAASTSARRTRPTWRRCGPRCSSPASPYDDVDADEIRRRFPQLRPTDDAVGFYQPDFAMLRADRCLAALAAQARAAGADLREGVTVTRRRGRRRRRRRHGRRRDDHRRRLRDRERLLARCRCWSTSGCARR